VLYLKASICCCLLLVSTVNAADEQPRIVLPLSGKWDFEQTVDAFPPSRFSRVIPVPGLIFLAEPRIDQFDSYYDGSYQPRYNWYRRKFTPPAEAEGMDGVVSILKSKYVTDVYLNGRHLGGSMSSYTPVEFPLGDIVRFGRENELLVRVGDRKWLPPQAAGSTDKEKVTYWPGIWDDVEVSFTGKFRVDRLLLLPDKSEERLEIKLEVRSFLPSQIQYGDPMSDSCQLVVTVREKKSGRTVTGPLKAVHAAKRDNRTRIEISVPLPEACPWTPEDPYLYEAEISLTDSSGKVSDRLSRSFGMRDFKREGRHFSLNDQRIMLRGTNITLHRFFEDPSCGNLPWDRQWVTRLLADIPRSLDWNAMRICVGVAPSFWYEIADSAGLLLQNEWLYWQSHGWDEQIGREYTDWVWADGNHPSIVIWDAINENWDDYVGNTLIPELKQLDPTRLWDAGYMTAEHMQLDEMDEPHPYVMWGHRTGFADNPGDPPYPLGSLHYISERFEPTLSSSSAQLVNEYGWVWLWRDGTPALLTREVYGHYFAGGSTTVEQRREFQAYWLQLQTEWLRTDRSLAGVLAFCYLTDDLGYTGDWFTNPVSELSGTATLDWFRHCFASSAVFIDLADTRYIKGLPAHQPGKRLAFNLVGVNDRASRVDGKIRLRLLDHQGRELHTRNSRISIPAWGKQLVPEVIDLPSNPGGYLLTADFTPVGEMKRTVTSRRYLRVGSKSDNYEYFSIEP
jgi:beta-galactosidase